MYPGRFDWEINILPPNAQQRLEILSAVLLPPVRVEGGERVLKRVAEAAVGYVGADLTFLSRNAVLSALKRGNISTLIPCRFFLNCPPPHLYVS